jgi:hypothetical protein
MKFQTRDEINNFSFDDAKILSLRMQDDTISFTFNGALVKAGNSQNARFQDMYCGEITLLLEGAKIVRLMKEGMKYYDADGKLQKEIPNEDVPAPAQQGVLERLKSGTVFTAVEDEVKDGYAYEFGIDVPQLQDDEEVDTFWLCIVFGHSLATWERYCSPAEEESRL